MDIIEEINIYKNKYPECEKLLSRIAEQYQEADEKEKIKYAIVLIAGKGKGKTTVINYLLSLLYEKEKPIEKSKRKYKVIEEVLETGSGATTTSEVEICQNEKLTTSIEIIPYTDEEVKEILISFVNYIYNKTFGLKQDEIINMAPELIRACRNMTGLTENRKDKIDLAVNLAQEFGKDNIEEFKNDVIEKAHLDLRKITEISYEFNGEGEKGWLKKAFRKVNLVHIPNVPLPKKVIVKLNKNMYNFDKLKCVDRIIDTRGLEIGSITDRRDIKEVFRGSDNKIILLVDQFNSPSKALIDLLGHYVYDKNMDCINRMAYIVNYRDNEPRNVLNCFGKAESEEDGINEKKTQLIQTFNDNNINFNNENIIYVNPRRFLNDEGKVKYDEDEDMIYCNEDIDYSDYTEREMKNYIINKKKEIRNLKRDVFESEIINIIDKYMLGLHTRKSEIVKRYNAIKRDIHQKSSVNMDEIFKKIENQDLIFEVKDRVTDMYDNYLSNKYPSTIMAINNRFGVYDNNDIYCEGGNFIENIVKRGLKKFKDELLSDLEEMKEEESLNSNQKNSIDFIISDINNYFFKYIEVINSFFANKLKSEVYNEKDIIFWDNLRKRWGMGAGYRQDIKDYYKQQIVDKKFTACVEENMTNLLSSFKVGLIDAINKAN